VDEHIGPAVAREHLPCGRAHRGLMAEVDRGRGVAVEDLDGVGGGQARGDGTADGA
jgi:hypothetical protein